MRTDCGGLNTRLEALVKLGYLLRGDHLSDADPPLEPLAADALAGSRS